MGVWDKGNFDSDTALEALDVVVNKLMREIVYALAPQHRGGMYRYLGLRMMAAIDMLLALEDHCGAMPGDVYPRLVRYWRDNCLSRYDEFGEDLDLPTAELKAERRQVIVDTFARLEAAVAVNEDEDDGVPLP
jgi:hypothetical protein